MISSRAQDQFLASIVGSTEDAIIGKDLAGVIRSWNPGAERMYGYTAEEAVGRHISLIVPETRRAELDTIMERLRTGKAIRRLETERVRKDGTTLFISLIISPIRDNSGTLIGASAIAHDISRQVRDRAILESKSKQLSSIANLGLQALSATDLATLLQEAANEARLLLNASRITIVDRRAPDHPAISTSVGTGGALAVTVPIDGTGEEAYGTLEAYLPAQATLDARDRDYLQSVANVIAAATRKFDQEKRENESLARFESVFEESPLGMAIVGTNRRFMAVNPRLTQMVGYSEDELVGATFDRITHPDDRESGTNPAAEAGRGDRSQVKYEKRYVTKQGETIWVRVTSSPARRTDGSIRHFVSMIEDVTEQRKAAEEIQRLNEELESRVKDRTEQLSQANQELEAFAYSVSHDLRAPLRSIDGFSRLILEDYADLLPDEGRHQLDRVRANAVKMDKLIQHLLHFARLTRAEAKREPVDANKLVHRVWEQHYSDRADRSVDFVVHPLPELQGDKNRLWSVFSNLIGNALKYTMHRDDARIEVGTVEREGRQVIYVADNGVGFDMKYADKLFDVFQRLHSEEEFEGSGVGLATVRRIVHRHGGSIWAEGEEAAGATFYFTLGEPEQGDE